MPGLAGGKFKGGEDGFDGFESHGGEGLGVIDTWGLG
jgi:hypothetical protein